MPETPDPRDEATLAGKWGAVVLVALAPAVFAVVTGNIWEDFFITYRCSLNLVQGNGLVFEAGRPLHVFTSPLGTLLPAGIGWLTRADNHETVLNIFRLLACTALAGAWALAAGRLSGRLAGGVALGLWTLDPKLAAFSTNGMETAFLVLFVMLAWRSLLDGDMGWAGVALGGALWTRPDGFIFFGAIAAGVLFFPGVRRPGWRGWLRLVGVAALIYAPWFVWAWSYYGSPIPNTILAKGAHLDAGASLHRLLTYPWRYVFGPSAAHDAFLPPYYFFGGWPGSLTWFGRVLALTAAVAALWPGCPRPARVAGLAFVIGGAYLTSTLRAPWYFPAWQLLAYLATAGVVAELAARLGSRRPRRLALGAGIAAVLLVQGWLFVSVAAQLRVQQEIVEWGVRAPIGRALRAAARHPRETVFLEPLGYIGFFSGLAMRDTPGLCAPEVVSLRKAGTLSMAGLVAALRPDWAVLREAEYAAFTPDEKLAFQQDYEFWEGRDARAAVSAVTWLPGREFLMFDAFYTIWRRRTEPPSRP